MKLIVGLGNPGKKYEENRHNIGFKIIDKVLEDNNFSVFKEKFQSHYSEGRIAGEKVALLKDIVEYETTPDYVKAEYKTWKQQNDQVYYQEEKTSIEINLLSLEEIFRILP